MMQIDMLNMSEQAAEKILVVLLRISGVGALFAIPFIFVPFSWMESIHAWLGLGQMMHSPMIEYLARSLSAFYAISGGLFLITALDVRKSRQVLMYLGVVISILGILFILIGYMADLPWWWIYLEGPPTILFGLSLPFLLNKMTPE